MNLSRFCGKRTVNQSVNVHNFNRSNYAIFTCAFLFLGVSSLRKNFATLSSKAPIGLFLIC